jgi:hypothetical protein
MQGNYSDAGVIAMCYTAGAVRNRYCLALRSTWCIWWSSILSRRYSEFNRISRRFRDQTGK